MIILVGDIGGTHSRIAYYEFRQRPTQIALSRRYIPVPTIPVSTQLSASSSQVTEQRANERASASPGRYATAGFGPPICRGLSMVRDLRKSSH